MGHTEYHDLTAAASPCQLLLRYRFSPYAWLPLCLNTQRAAQLCANAAAWQPQHLQTEVWCRNAKHVPGRSALLKQRCLALGTWIVARASYPLVKLSLCAFRHCKKLASCSACFCSAVG